MIVYLKSIGIIAPGIASWEEAVALLTQPDRYSPAVLKNAGAKSSLAKNLATVLPPNERRRATRVTQLALSAAQQIGNHAELSQCLQIFSCSNGDLSTFHQISQALAMEGRPVSPTRFHNSVHNAPAGYWSIATQSQTPSTSITAGSDSFSAGLLEAAVQVNASDNQLGSDCLLVSYDEIPPDPFYPLLQTTEEFACAFRIGQSGENALCKMELSLSHEPGANEVQPVTQLPQNEMEYLRCSNPQARALPLLVALANQQHTMIRLPYFEQGLEVLLTPIVQGGR